MTGWTALLLAGLLEVGFTTTMKLSQTHPRYLWPFILLALGSFAMLTVAMKTIPLGTAYAVWTGIGAVGTTLVGIVIFKDRATPLSLGLLGLAVLLIMALKVTS